VDVIQGGPGRGTSPKRHLGHRAPTHFRAQGQRAAVQRHNALGQRQPYTVPYYPTHARRPKKRLKYLPEVGFGDALASIGYAHQ